MTSGPVVGSGTVATSSTGEFMKDGNPNIFYCNSPEEARGDANQIEKFSGL